MILSYMQIALRIRKNLLKLIFPQVQYQIRVLALVTNHYDNKKSYCKNIYRTKIHVTEKEFSLT